MSSSSPAEPWFCFEIRKGEKFSFSHILVIALCDGDIHSNPKFSIVFQRRI